jgi:hypothetical protein
VSNPSTITSSTPSPWTLPLRRLRRALAKENMKDLLGTLGLVSVLTVLIWVWAERELVVKDKPLTPFTLEIRSAQMDRIVTVVAGGGFGNISCDLSCHAR